MIGPPRINDQALPTLEAISRFWQFKRKKLAGELQAHLLDTQRQLDALYGLNQQLTEQCDTQSDDIQSLQSHSGSLAIQLQAETASLASTSEAFAQEKIKLRKAMVALTQARVKVRELENSQAQVLEQVTQLEAFLEDHKNQLLSKEQSISELRGNLLDTQRQLDELYGVKQQLTAQCATQNDDIRTLQSHSESLAEQLQAETASLASTSEAFAQEKIKSQNALVALTQARVKVRELENSQAQVLEQVTQLEAFLEDHKNQLLSKEQSISELRGNLLDTQRQLDELYGVKQQLTAQCATQNDDIRTLQSHSESLAEQLQAETASLASTSEAFAQEKIKSQNALVALTQAQANAREQELRQAQVLEQVTQLEAFLEDHKNQLLSKEQSISELRGNLLDTQRQLDELYGVKQQLTAQCATQNDDIRTLQSHSESLAEQLQAETASLASTSEAFAQEKIKSQNALVALTQAQANAREQELRQAQALEQVTQLEAFLEDHKNQLLSKEQSVNFLESLAEQLKASQQSLESSYEDINQRHLSLTEKFALVSKVLAQQPPRNDALAAFAELINNDYMDFAGRESSLAGEAQAVLEMQAIVAEMQMVTNFPSIAGKTILSIAGGFSSGKSAFVNSFIKDQSAQLATGLTPVTVVPSYVVCSEETRIKGYSYNGGSIELDHKLYASLSHEYVKAFGFDLRRILPFISVNVPMDPELFDNLCIIDTPGYNPGGFSGAEAADRGSAASLVNQASALVWVVGLDPAGTIDRTDIEFIESTPFRGDSLYIVLNKADVKSAQDIEQIMEQVADDLSYADIAFAGMCAYSSTRKKEYAVSGKTFTDFLRSTNRKLDVMGKIGAKLDAVFDDYKQAIEADIEQLESRKGEFHAFKLDALEIGGTVLFDRIDQAFPLGEQMFETSGLEKLVDECQTLRRTLKLAAQKALA